MWTTFWTNKRYVHPFETDTRETLLYSFGPCERHSKPTKDMYIPLRLTPEKLFCTFLVHVNVILNQQKICTSLWDWHQRNSSVHFWSMWTHSKPIKDTSIPLRPTPELLFVYTVQLTENDRPNNLIQGRLLSSIYFVGKLLMTCVDTVPFAWSLTHRHIPNIFAQVSAHIRLHWNKVIQEHFSPSFLFFFLPVFLFFLLFLICIFFLCILCFLGWLLLSLWLKSSLLDCELGLHDCV